MLQALEYISTNKKEKEKSSGNIESQAKNSFSTEETDDWMSIRNNSFLLLDDMIDSGVNINIEKDDSCNKSAGNISKNVRVFRCMYIS